MIEDRGRRINPGSEVCRCELCLIPEKEHSAFRLANKVWGTTVDKFARPPVIDRSDPSSGARFVGLMFVIFSLIALGILILGLVLLIGD